MTTTLGMPATWSAAASSECKHFWFRKNGDSRTSSLIDASQPRCRLPPCSSWVHNLSCKHPRKQVPLQSLSVKSPKTKMATCSYKLIFETKFSCISDTLILCKVALSAFLMPILSMPSKKTVLRFREHLVSFQINLMFFITVRYSHDSESKAFESSRTGLVLVTDPTRHDIDSLKYHLIRFF